MSSVPWIFLIAILLAYWWRNGSFKEEATRLAMLHCQQLELQLLDQTVVMRALWPVQVAGSYLALRRKYQFEFTSTGEQRYQGQLILKGMRLDSVQLETYKIPS